MPSEGTFPVRLHLLHDRYTEPDEAMAAIENSPLFKELQQKYQEYRDPMTRPVPNKKHDLMTALLGPLKIEGTPRAWTSDDQKVHIRIYYLGSSLCFHQGVAHGGLLATLMDEAFARCAPFLPHNVGATASFTLDYRAPVHVTQYIVLHAEIVNVEGRKAWLQRYITPLPASNEKPPVLVEASSLFVSPREAEASVFHDIFYN